MRLLLNPRKWTREERMEYEYRPACSICGTSPGVGVLEYGDDIVDVKDPSMVKGMCEDQPEMIESVMEASKDESDFLFLCHAGCAANGGSNGR